MPTESLTYKGRIVDVQRTQEGYAVGIDLNDSRNAIFYIFMAQEPHGNYLEYYTMFDVAKPESRIVISTPKESK